MLLSPRRSHGSTPVGATVFGALPTRTTWPRRYLPSLLVLVAGVGVALASFALLSVRQHEKEGLAFEKRSVGLANAVEQGLYLPVEVLQSLPALFQASVDVSREEFRDFTAGALARHPGIYALEWLPLVPAEERDAYEAAARADGLEGFQFTEVGEGGEMVRADERPFHLPIFYMEPPNPTALGFDVASEPLRLAPPEKAALSGTTIASSRIHLVEDEPDISSIAVFHAVYRHGVPLGSPEERRHALRGVAAEVFRVGPMVESALRSADLAGLDLAVVDTSVPGQAVTLYETAPGARSERASTPDALMTSVEFPFADRTWSLVFVATADARRDRTVPLSVLTVVLLLSVLVAGAMAGYTTIVDLRHRMQDALKLGQYTLVEKIGEGGMGVVYKARHALLRRPTALKLLPRARSSGVMLERFEREVQLTSQLTHPNTIAIYDYGRTSEGILYYVMEYVDGVSLDRLVEAYGAVSPERTVAILRQVCGSLAEAHDVGLVHRDIKPANLMVCIRGGVVDFVKVLDFGLVKQLDEAGSNLSRPEWVIGTPLYMAPETISESGRTDARSDLYALGAVAYFLLTGSPVFSGKTMVEVCSHHLRSTPVPPSQRVEGRLSPELERLVLSCLEKDPARRPASAREILAALDALEDVGAWTQDAARAWWEQHEPERLKAASGATASMDRAREPS
jgi:serine/threonine-protein kinase